MSDRIQSPKEEKANMLTHAAGILFALVAMPFLIAYAVEYGTARSIWAVSVFGFGMLMVYLSSTLYHAATHTGTKRALRIWDHISIFLLIGGTYTAVIQKFTDADTATVFLTTMWCIIAVGSGLKLFFTGKFKVVELLLYLGLGWMAVFIIKPLSTNLPLEVFWWILAGGLFYMFGVVFYVWKKLQYHHAIWHCFVLAGTVTHYVAVFKGTLSKVQVG
ncbi:MAG: hemolysin III family protein [Chitinophagales bacterium]|nr:hemolysin III family protein [Chitinophagales bacterium]